MGNVCILGDKLLIERGKEAEAFSLRQGLFFFPYSCFSEAAFSWKSGIKYFFQLA